MSDIVRTRRATPYKTSCDYIHLWELAQKYSVVCFADYKWDDGYTCRDVCATVFHLDSHRIALSVRGCEYLDADNVDDFVKDCKRYNIEFIPPENLPREA